MLTEAKVRSMKNSLKLAIRMIVHDPSIDDDDDDGRALFHIYGALLWILEEEPKGTSIEATIASVLHNKGVYDKSKGILEAALANGDVPADLVDEVKARLDNNLN